MTALIVWLIQADIHLGSRRNRETCHHTTQDTGALPWRRPPQRHGDGFQSSNGGGACVERNSCDLRALARSIWGIS